MKLSDYNNQPHFMQSEQFAEYLGSLGWHTTVISKPFKTYVYSKKLSLAGTIAKIPKAYFPISFHEVEAHLRKNRLVMIRLEPNVMVPKRAAEKVKLQDYLRSHGYVPTWLACELQVVRVDLSPTVETIFKRFPRENTKRNIRVALKNKLTAEESDDLPLFHTLHQQTARRKHFYCPPLKEMNQLWQSFAKTNDAKIVMVRDAGGKAVASIFLLLYKGIAYYRFVGALPEALGSRAPTFAAWEAMKIAKNSGCQWFEFMGVNDPRHPDKRWEGFSRFKWGFVDKGIPLMEPAAKYYPGIGTILKHIDRIM